MSKKINVEFVIRGKVETTATLPSLPIVESKAKRGRKKRAVIDEEESEDNVSEVNVSGSRNAFDESSENESQTKKSRGRSSGRKKKVQEDEEEEEFPAPKSKPVRGRGQSKRGRPAKKAPDASSRDEESSVVSSSKNADDSSSNNDNMEIEEEDLDEEEMKLDDDDDEDQLLDEDNDDFEETLDEINSVSTKNLLRLTKMQQDDSASDKGGVTDINSLNIDMNKLTRRQKAQLKNQANLDIDIEEPLFQLPDKKSKKKKEDLLTEEQQVKKMEIANKRKILNQKLQEEQKKKTINKILNEAGRKQKQRKEQEERSLKEKDTHKFRTLPEGEVGIKYVSSAAGIFLKLPEGFNTQELLNGSS